MVVPVSDVDRAKSFYTRLGWRLDADVAPGERRIGAEDKNWPDWYAQYMVGEQAGTGLPS
ncbi:VOC family protein [Streptomyces rishiriensis]|uniref:VOC family protein n=1 Tax=Streptomyces rishiriensis TaxID=68264 RepID=UPI0037BC8CB2